MLETKGNKAYTTCIQNGIPVGYNSDTQVRLGKDRLGKESIGEVIIPEPEAEKTKKEKPVRHKYGEYNNVLLTDEDYQKLQAEFPSDYKDRIERLSSYMASTGKTYKNHLATIRNWARKDKDSGQKQQTPDIKFKDDLFI
jgi:hypothetical protein